MLRNYLLIAFRNLSRHKFYSIINIFGLALGMSVCLIMLTVINDIYSYDSFHPHPERTYRITTRVSTASDLVHCARSPLPLGNTLNSNYPFIEQVVRIYPAEVIRRSEVTYEDKTLPMPGAFADDSFFDVFGFTLASGNAEKALAEPYSVVLTSAAATKLFGEKEALGETLSLGKLGDFKVTGVLAKPPQNTHLHYELYTSLNTVPLLEAAGKIDRILESWKEYDAGFSYVLLKPEASVETLIASLPPIAQRGMKTFEFNSKGTAKSYAFAVQAVDAIVPTSLYMDTWAGMSVSGLMVFSGIALAILLIASFNYTNLSVARSLRRAKEVGIRKVTGATRRNILYQFLSESVLFSLFALLLSFLFTEILFLNPSFSQLVAGVALDVELVLWFLAFSVGVGLLVGFLPAMLFSQINTIQALKSLAGHTFFKVGTWRKGLIVAQFSISLVFVIFVLVTYQQSNYVATANNGYDRDNIITVDLQDINHELVASKLEAHTNVQEVTAASGNFGLTFGSPLEVQKQRGDEPIFLTQYAIDPNFVPTMGIKLLAGKNLPKHNSFTDALHIILNAKAAQVLGMGSANQAVGANLWLSDSLPVEVVGVVDDFHYLSLKHPIGPMALRYYPGDFRILNLKVKDPYDTSFEAFLQKSWVDLGSTLPLQYYVYEDQFFEKWIHAEETTFVGSLAAMAIFIACLGLLGVVMYSMETRIKEIGIRKVIGASAVSLTTLLSQDFLKLLFLAGAFALPAGYWAGTVFLQEYAYRITIGVELLSVGFGIVLLLGLVIISSQTIRAALANPVDSLRNE